ncbi:MAG TPA: hypothetical protein VET46_05740 [Steroidobacteraceae bacterium]|nr:hypothetical protein [Steroidobacteraceae bacterium]
MRQIIARTVVALVLLAGIGAAVLPFLTGGACTAEFDAISDRLERARPQLLTLAQAQAFLTTQGMSYEALTPERCSTWHPRDLAVECPTGMLLVGLVPVTNRVCRYYRDPNVLFRLAYNGRQQLIRIQTDMKPYTMVRTPWGAELYLAR